MMRIVGTQDPLPSAHPPFADASVKNARLAAGPIPYYSIFALVLSIACLRLVWLNEWLAVDAFILFRYAAQTWAGHGLVWNIGERVQGFTCPLWQLLLCAMPAEITCLWSLLMGMFFTALTLVGAASLFRRTVRPFVGFGLFCLAFFSSKSVLEWSTSGLENSLNHAMLAMAYAFALAPGRPAKRAWGRALPPDCWRLIGSINCCSSDLCSCT